MASLCMHATETNSLLFMIISVVVLMSEDSFMNQTALYIILGALINMVQLVYHYEFIIK